MTVSSMVGVRPPTGCWISTEQTFVGFWVTDPDQVITSMVQAAVVMRGSLSCPA
jgi:hypothetical protein